jgi:peptidoglycan-associated lipoprotein
MKQFTFSKLTILALILTASMIGSGCKKRALSLTPINKTPSGVVGDSGRPNSPERSGTLPPENNTTTTIPRTTSTEPIPPAERTGGGIGKFNDPDTLKSETVHFDFDRAVVKTSEKPKVERVASYLKANGNADILIEGHCDERGTEGYNMALGERRALAVREALVGLGVSPDKIQTISYGESRPIEAGHTESAWSQNRRAAFVLAK